MNEHPYMDTAARGVCDVCDQPPHRLHGPAMSKRVRLLSEALGWYWIRLGDTAHLVPPRLRADMRTACDRPAVTSGKRIRPAGAARRCAACEARDGMVDS